MSHKWITDINEDKSGNVWVSTLNGITLFKGKDIAYLNKKDGIVNKRIYSVEPDSKGNVWLGTRKGVSVYDGKNWKTYNRKNGLITNQVVDIMEDINGNMWFATPKGISVFDGEDWRSYDKNDGLARNMAMSMDEDSNGKIWFGSLNGAFSSFNDSTWQNIKKGSGYYNYTYPLMGLIEGVTFTLLFGTPGAGVVMLVLFAPLGALPSQPTIVYIDSKNNVWLAAQPKGVFMFDGQDWMQYTTINGLPHKRVNTILETSDGAMWFGTSMGIAVMNK